MLFLALFLAALVHDVEAGKKCDPLKHTKTVEVLITELDEKSKKPKFLYDKKYLRNPASAAFEMCPDKDGKCIEEQFFCTKKKKDEEDAKCEGRCIRDQEEAEAKKHKAGDKSKEKAVKEALKKVFVDDDTGEPETLLGQLFEDCREYGVSFRHKFALKDGKKDTGEKTEVVEEDAEEERRLGSKGEKAKYGEEESHVFRCDFTNRWTGLKDGVEPLAFAAAFKLEEDTDPVRQGWLTCDEKTKKDANKIKKLKFNEIETFHYADVFFQKKINGDFQCPWKVGGGGKSSSGSGVVVVIVILLLLLLAGAGAGMMMMQKNKPLMPPTSTAQLMESQQKTIEMSSR